MAKSVAIIQSNYIPWKGYFDIIRSVDEFLLYDDQQYVSGQYRNRNQIKTQKGPVWVTIPVVRNFGQKICEAKVASSKWTRAHWRSLEVNYGRTEYFSQYSNEIHSCYESLHNEESLSAINRTFIEMVCRILAITTPIKWSWEYDVTGTKSERVLQLCKAASADRYLSGPAAQAYLDVPLFKAAGVDVIWADYTQYPEYPQLFPPFTHGVTALDLIFNLGPNALECMKKFN